MRKLLLLLVITLLLPACDRSQRRASAGSFGSAVADTVTRHWRGIYTRDGGRKMFRLCGTTVRYVVSADTLLLSRLDANVDWHAPRPTTTIFAALTGDTSNTGIEGDTSFAGTLTLTVIDTTREAAGNECAPIRPPEPPPADRRAIAAGVRRALGADAMHAESSSWTSASIWLDEDWHGDAVVLLVGERFCGPRGCTLLVLAGTPDGYESVGRVTEALAPVVLLPGSSNGWRDLSVRWNGGAYGDKYTVLRFGARAYPSNASLQPEHRPSADSGRTVIAVSAPPPSR